MLWFVMETAWIYPFYVPQVHKREEGAAGACMNPMHLPQESIWNIHVPPQISLYMTPAAENEPYKWF